MTADDPPAAAPVKSRSAPSTSSSIRCDECTTWTALDKAFPTKLGQEVRIIRERDDGSFYRACPKCEAELDLESGEWVADFPDRPIHGYRISQPISSKVDPGEILHEYHNTRFPGRFYNLKIGIAWADTQNRLTTEEVLACCGEHGMEDSSKERCTMGVDTGNDLHVVIARRGRHKGARQVLYIGTRQHYSELDELMRRYNVGLCVIDAQPEIHSTREFAGRHPGRAFVNYFLESQRGSYKWSREERIVQENRTEALDASRQAIRERQVILPRGGAVIQEFAEHMASDVKQLVEDKDTGAKVFRYVRTATDHYSLAFTYECVAASRYVPIDLSRYGWL